jgi:hypothetical protein
MTTAIAPGAHNETPGGCRAGKEPRLELGPPRPLCLEGSRFKGVGSIECAVPSTQYPVLSTEYAVPSARYGMLNPAAWRAFPAVGPSHVALRAPYSGMRASYWVLSTRYWLLCPRRLTAPAKCYGAYFFSFAADGLTAMPNIAAAASARPLG